MAPLHNPYAVTLPGGVCIPHGELEFSFVRSPGPGGQHANKVSTRVELRFDLDRSPSLTDALRQRARSRLGGRLTRSGYVLVASSRYRSQLRNRRDCVERFAALMTEALRPPPPPRRRSKPGRAAVARRLDEKKQTAKRKHLRRRPGGQ